jgi:hypothetical protein
MVQKGHLALVEKGRQVTGSGAAPRRLGRLITKPLSRFNVVGLSYLPSSWAEQYVIPADTGRLQDNVVRYILTLPLNLIPVVGTAFFLMYVYSSMRSQAEAHVSSFNGDCRDTLSREARSQGRG